MDRQEEQCANCHYVGRPRQIGAHWICRRNPPILQWMVAPQEEEGAGGIKTGRVMMLPTPAGGWPSTEPDQWCGEYRPMGKMGAQ